MKKNNKDIKFGHVLLKHKRRLLIISSLLIVVFFSITTVVATFDDLISRFDSDFSAAIHAIEKQYESTTEKDMCYLQSMADVSENFGAYSAYFIGKHGYTKKTTLELSKELDQYFDGFYFDGTLDDETKTATGNIYSLFDYNAKSSIPLLTSERLYTLLTEGELVDENTTNDALAFTSSKVEDGKYTILSWGATDFILRQDILSTFPSDISETFCRINSQTLIIEDSNKYDLIGTSFDKSVSNSLSFDDVVSDKIILIDSPTNKSNLLAYVCKDSANMYVIGYLPVRNLVSLFLRRCAIPLILTNVFLILILIYVLGFMKPHDASEKEEIEYFHFFKNIYSDGRLVSHNLGIGLMAMVVVMIATLYVETLINYCNQNINAAFNLSTLSCYITNAETNAAAMTEDFDATNALFSNTLADYFLKYPEEVNDDDLATMLEKIPNLTSITIMNKTGTIVADTDTRNGYTISQDSSSPEYKCWEILNGNCADGSYKQDSKYYIVSRRQDAVGVIRIGITASNLYRFLKLCSLDEQLNSVNFQSSNKGYLDKLHPELLYLMEPNSSQIISISSPIHDEKLLSDGFSGMRKLGSKRFFVNISETEQYYLISALRFSMLYGQENIIVIFAIFLAFFIQQVIIFITSLRQKDEIPTQLVEITNSTRINASVNDQLMDSSFRKLFRNILIITGITVVALLIIDSIFEQTSILSYIFEASWPKGFNLFSITMILITLVMGAIISRIIQGLIIFLTKSMGSRGLTIGRMLCSFIQFLTLIIVVLLVLIDLGVDYRTLLTGAGIAGIAVTVCAQSSISDMLSGFLIVFENLFNIGDWLTVNDFRGEVIDIGMRTTKLQISNTVKIFNNSTLKDVTVMERNGQGCVVLVDIAYKEDANKVIELLRNSTKRYVHDIPAIKEGPFIDGIVDLNSSGVTLYIWAITDLEVVRATEREIRRVTKNIFDENKIEIPFTQVTLHQADEIAHFNGLDAKPASSTDNE